MAVHPVLLYGDPRLEACNAPVERFGGELDELIRDLFETAWRAPGLGLAAPQIGVNLRLAVVDLSVGEDPDARIVLGAVAPVPLRALAAEEVLKNRVMDDRAINEASLAAVSGAVPLTGNTYKPELTRVLVRRALTPD